MNITERKMYHVYFVIKVILSLHAFSSGCHLTILLLVIKLDFKKLHRNVKAILLIAYLGQTWGKKKKKVVLNIGQLEKKRSKHLQVVIIFKNNIPLYILLLSPFTIVVNIFEWFLPNHFKCRPFKTANDFTKSGDGKSWYYWKERWESYWLWQEVFNSFMWRNPKFQRQN